MDVPKGGFIDKFKSSPELQQHVDFAGAGASVPLLGFGHLLAQGVQNAVDECGLPGAFTGGLTAASGGIAASLIFGVLAALVGKSKDQN